MYCWVGGILWSLELGAIFIRIKRIGGTDSDELYGAQVRQLPIYIDQRCLDHLGI